MVFSRDSDAELLTKNAHTALASLWSNDFNGPLVSGQEIVPGIMWHMDPEGVQSVKAVISSDIGIRFDNSVERAGAWVALHVPLGNIALERIALTGVYIESSAPRATSYRCCLRSGLPGGFVDHFFHKDVAAYASLSTHTDALTMASLQDVPFKRTWREFIVFFPTNSFSISLRDLRFFAA